MAQLKNLIVNGASRFLTPIKGDLSGTSDYSLKMETYKQGSSTETYGASYPLWAQWETGSVLKLLCTGYSTKVDLANTLATARTIRTNLASTSTASFDGSANITPGVTGTLPVGNGGTGATTFTSTAALVGNGTSAISASNLKISGYTATLASSSTDDVKYVSTNSNGSVSLWASSNRGLYDQTSSKWIIASKQDGSKTYVPRWASLGGTAKPVYFDSDGSAVACSSTVGGTVGPVYMNAGTITACTKPSSGAWFGGVCTIGSDGVAEYGRYIDFHYTSASTNDYDVRIDCAGNSKNTIYLPAVTGQAVVHTNDTAIGSATKPVYIAATGLATACSTYAGGTAVTLNGSSKAASTASFYAPTAGGTSGYVLVGAGTTTVPAWKSLSDAGIAASSHTHAASDITSGTLAVARGGTGKTTGNAAANYFINELTTGSSNPTDADYYVCQYAGGGTSTTTYHRRPHSALYSYIVGKADSRYVRLTTNQTIADNKTFSAATYFDSGVYPSTAGEGNVGTLARPWEYISGKYIRACDGTNENYYCYMRPYTVGTTSTIGNGRLTLGNSIAEGTAGNARGSLVIYSGGTQYCIITGYAGYISFTFG